MRRCPTTTSTTDDLTAPDAAAKSADGADAGMIRRKDEEQLALATVQGRALYSFNVRDYQDRSGTFSLTGFRV